MKKVRIALQEYDEHNKPSSFDNMMLHVDDYVSLSNIKEQLLKSSFVQITHLKWAEDKMPVIKDDSLFSSDLFDKESVGYDISCEEFVDNEIFFATKGDDT